ncbi:MAG: DUF192 domain-containing protein [Iphinoe sp. HA4291-MV1]|jgi:hypothetical protein|nr:DUF192 domain-containing protein [Iphinoe sp. HA4291-MV1]
MNTTTVQNNQSQKQHDQENIFLRVLKIVGPIAGFLAATSPLAYMVLHHQPQKLPIGATLTINNHTIEMEVAQQPHELAKGLKFRSALPSNRGMLFVPEKPQRIKLWMKDMRFPIDMVFVRNGTVVSIVENAPPCKQQPCPLYDSIKDVDKVIELPAHTIGKINLKTGSAININFLLPLQARRYTTVKKSNT